MRIFFEANGKKQSNYYLHYSFKVVQRFRKLIHCERCALFLLDKSTNELYFKPVAGSDSSNTKYSTDVKEIRIPSTQGVAGWVATHKQMLNIKDVSKDSRFYSGVDKMTSFKTRTILCMPVISSTDDLIGVVQMVNKQIKEENVKKSSSATKYRRKSHLVHFTLSDEQLLKKCCDQLSPGLEAVLCPTQTESAADVIATTKGMSNSNNLSIKELHCRRRTSISHLFQYVKRAESDINPVQRRKSVFASGVDGLTEALTRFEFRSAHGPQISNRKNIIMEEDANKPSKGSDINPVQRRKSVFASGVDGLTEALTRFEFRSAHGPQISARKNIIMEENANKPSKQRWRRVSEFVHTTDIKELAYQDQEEENISILVRNLKKLGSKFRVLLYCESCRFFFLEPSKEHYFWVDDNGKQIKYPISQNSFVSTVMQNGQPELVLNASKDSRFENFENPNRLKLWNVLCQPVFHNNQTNEVVAVMEMVNSLKIEGFSEKDRNLFEICSMKSKLIFPVVRDLLNNEATGKSTSQQENELIYAEKVSALGLEIEDEQKKLIDVKVKNSIATPMDSKSERRSIIKQVYSEAASSKKRQPPVLKKKLTKSEQNWKEFDKIFNN